jgi:K319-like protein
MVNVAATSGIVSLIISVLGVIGILQHWWTTGVAAPPPSSPPPPLPTNLEACANVNPTNPISGQLVTLDASCSTTDPNGLIMSYSWKQIHGHKVHLSNNHDRISMFTAPRVSSLTTLTFQLTVTDNHSRKELLTKDVTVMSS